MPDFSYHGRFVPWTFRTFLTFRTIVRILVSSTFLSRVSKVAIKVVGLRREHRARLLKRTNAKDQAATAADDDNAADGPTTTTQMPYQHLQQYICRRFNLSPFWLSYIIFDAVFVCRRIQFLRRYEKSENGTKSPQMVRNVYGTKSLVPQNLLNIIFKNQK